MKHLILGAGNLGHDLLDTLRRGHQEAWLFAPDLDGSTGMFQGFFSYPNSIDCLPTDEDDDSVIWCCVGAGSVDGAKEDFNRYIDLHVGLPSLLIQNAPPKTHLIFFSTDYVASEMLSSDPDRATIAPKSLYAYSKLWMEQLIIASARPRTVAIRVGTLYGNHRPERTFPGKLKATAHDLTPLEIPINRVTPTPTWWLAEILAERWQDLFAQDRLPIHHLAPTGNVSTMSWARMFMPDKFKIKPAGTDPERPGVSYLGCTIPGYCAPTWDYFWNDERNYLK